MFPLKRFVQGPSLHEESVSNPRTKQCSSTTGTLNGEEARKAYEEIISLPSTSASAVISPVESSTASRKRTRSKLISVDSAVVEDTTVPKLSRLFLYCESNNHACLEKVLKRFRNEIDINSVDEYDWTMLMSASCAGSLECVSILLQHGANWNYKNKKGQTALCLAKKRHQVAVCNFIEEWIHCFMEQQNRNQQQSHNPSESNSQNQSNTEEQATPSSQYCESCKINYASSKESHERSIAHLVSTAQFGGDKVHFGIPESNKGFQLMVKSGWDMNSGLGPEGSGQKFPVKTILKRNKLGLGNEKEKKTARITHFGPFDPAAVQTNPERIEREVTVRRREAHKRKSKEKRQEIRFRREFSLL